MTAPKDPTGRVIAEILDGRHDGRLLELVDAITTRATSDETSFLWRIRLGDDVWDAETVTLGELREAEKLTNRSYLQLDPKKFMTHFTALVYAHYRKVHDLDEDAAVAKAEKITQQQAMDALEIYEGSLGKGSASTTS